MRRSDQVSPMLRLLTINFIVVVGTQSRMVVRKSTSIKRQSNVGQLVTNG